MKRKKFVCEDKYEAEKLGNMLYVKDKSQSNIKEIVNVVEHEVVISLKDESVHSVLLKDKFETESFADFMQSVIEKKDSIKGTNVMDDIVEITKE